MNTLTHLFRHLWLDADDAHRAIGSDGLARLEARITESESAHSGQICLCIEASLPLRYLWRALRHGEPIGEVLRDRALTTFGKQRVWDTEQNNGVLIYLSLAEHHLEILADRGLARLVPNEEWQAVVKESSRSLHAGHLEEGLALALDGVHARLARHYPASDEESAARENTLPDRPILR
ncbi:TPM domain-containing protein [Thauera sp.]|uniref:TPM domain-containing protein n=1 Tax=Thauera sp. TaxID=1905334 RepID=UPI0039E2C583